MSDRSSDTLWPRRESGFDFHLPPDGAAIDGDAWLAPLAVDGIKSVDFIQRRAGALWFIEAKSSMPQPDGQSQRPGALAERCAEVVDKAACAIQALLATLAGRTHRPALTLPAWWTDADRTCDWVLVLVVTRAEKAWLADMRNMLRERLRPLARTTAVAIEPKVVNAEMAQRLRLGQLAPAR